MAEIRAFHQFPRGFLWGTASASHQVEGQNHNSDWWHWEQTPGNILNNDSSAVACDWWGGRYLEDFDRMAADGHNSHRLSVEWSRIEPGPSVWDEDAIAFYRDMLLALRERNIEPMVTLCHYCHPQWFIERGGWEQDDAVAIFERYARKVVRELGDLVTLWCTINEPNAYVFQAYMDGVFPPGVKDFRQAMRVSVNLYRAHVATYHAIHQIQPEAEVGYALHVRWFDPANPSSALDRRVAKAVFANFNLAWPQASLDGKFRTPLGKTTVSEGIGAMDWLGLNYYTRDLVAFDLRKPMELFSRRFFHPDDPVSPTGFIASYPEGLYKMLKWGYQFGKPIFVAENGIEDPGDHLRPRFIVEHIRQLWAAVNYGFRVRGYYHWTLVDNFEWERGWSQRFGLYALDVETQVRTPRGSAQLYADICRANGLGSEIVAHHVPELLQVMFPGGV